MNYLSISRPLKETKVNEMLNPTIQQSPLYEIAMSLFMEEEEGKILQYMWLVC